MCMIYVHMLYMYIHTYMSAYGTNIQLKDWYKVTVCKIISFLYISNSCRLKERLTTTLN